MAIKATIYFPDQIIRRIGDLPSDIRLGARVNDMLDRYGAALAIARREVLSALSEEDRCVLQTACGAWLTRGEPADVLLGGIAAEVRDAALPGGDLHGSDVSQLLGWIDGLSPMQQFALVEWLEQPAQSK